ncbi:MULTISPECIES: hypothetical protein [Prauserella]|uniref:hypothetical protein n=1 Tax=Prauserella sp. PE36 TaxID=1504709 RepID=UPI000D80FF24|nr:MULTISPECIES: hypothetical protein [Prauserella]PXY26066.1 hypothetical protein BAY59_21225 [Prauserella coralliicola]
MFDTSPLLPLGGGHIAVVWYERPRNRIRALRGRADGSPVDYTRLSTVTPGLVLTSTADIVNPVRLT